MRDSYPVRDRKPGCAEGRHWPGAVLKRVDAASQSGLPYTRCRHCGQLLVKSPMMRRWRITGMIG